MFWIPFMVINLIAFSVFLGYANEPWDEDAIKICFWVTALGPITWVIAAIVATGYYTMRFGKVLHGLGKQIREGKWKSYRLFGRINQKA